MQMKLIPSVVAVLATAVATTAANARDISVAAGGFVTVSPLYEGSDEYKVRGVPIIYPTFGNGEGPSRLFFRGVDDVRYAVFQDMGVSVGPLLGYRFGRDAADAAELGGLGDVDGGVVVGGFAQYEYGGAFADIAFSKQVSGLSDSGFLVKFGAGHDFDITERLSGRIYVAGTYASDDYMDNYFSITPAQSGASAAGYGVFDAGGGVKNVEINTSVEFKANAQTSLRASAGYSRLIGDAADSPISVSDDQFSGGLGFLYRF